MDFSNISSLDTSIFLALNGSDSLFLDALALTFTSAYTWILFYVALFFLVVKNNGKASQILFVILACALCIALATGASAGLIKPYAARLRPSYEPTLAHVIDLADNYRASGYSFFSSHAANTFSIAVFFSLLVRNRIFTTFMLGWSLLNCWTRLYLGVHYPSDILAGLLCGFFSGMIAYLFYQFLYRKTTPRLHYISTQYTKTGYSLPDIDVVLNILTLTFIYAILRAAITAF